MDAGTTHGDHEAPGERARDQGETPMQLPDVGAPELQEALDRCNFPVIIWDASRGVVELANQAAADLLERPLSGLVGSQLVDLAAPREAVQRAIDDIESGTFDGLRSRREISIPDVGNVEIQAWTRAIDLAGTSGGATLVIPDSQIAMLGRDPAQPWRELTRIAVALIDSDWRIEGISTDIEHLLELTPRECIGRRLTELVHPDDVPRLLGSDGHPPTSTTARRGIRVARRDGSWVSVCFMLSPASDRGQGQTWVGMIGASAPLSAADNANDRVRELEFRLRRIGTEVRAAGLLDNVSALPPPQDYPEVGELTARQWEILSLLVQGQRVSTIAQNLFVSQSTVRNHLATMFKKFGVHSQAELLEKVRKRNVEAAS